MARSRTTGFPDELLEEKCENVTKSFENLHNTVHARYNETDRKLVEDKNVLLKELADIKTQVMFTNGKVRKVILALVLAFGLILGLGFQQLGPVLTILLGA
jgi:hypothetical protein